jgi:tetratricopeptide (TPR) repeat protein
VYLGRAYVGIGNYAEALPVLEPLSAVSDCIGTEALAYASLALSLQGRHEDAVARLEEAGASAEKLGSARLEALV